MNPQAKTFPSVILIVNTMIGLGIMFFGHLMQFDPFAVAPNAKLLSLGLPMVNDQVLIQITPIGMKALAIFLGVVYLWTFVDTLWPCFLGVFLLANSGFAPVPGVLNLFMGNPNTVMILMLFIFAAAFTHSQVAVYLTRWLMTRKIVIGRPWLLTANILMTCYLVAFLDQVTSVFIMWPTIYLIFKEVGFKKGDKYVSLLVVNSLIMILLSFATDAIKGGAFYLVAGLYGFARANPDLNVPEFNLAAYILFAIILSVVIMFILLAIMRFVYRPDVSLLKNFDVSIFDKNPLPPMSWKQKTLIGLFIFYALWMILPGVLPADNVVGMFLRKNLFSGSLVAVLLLTVIRYKGEPLADIAQTNAAFPWKVFFLIATAFVLGNALTSPTTNVSLLMEYVLRDTFVGVSYFSLTIYTIIIAIVVTNFTNSVVTGLIFAPVLIAVCNAYGFSPTPLLACFFYTVLVAAATPAASPYAAMLFSNNEWISKTDALHYASVASLVVVAVVILLGIPMANMFF